MKRYLILIVVIASSIKSFSQILPGTLDVTGMPSVSQNIADLVTEAGQDDDTIGFESNFDEALISFALDPTSAPIVGVVATSEQNCSANVYRYSVFMHIQYDAPANVIIEAKTTSNSGFRFPAVSPYDNLIIQPLGPRDLFPENGGNYIEIPNDAGAAIKVMEFVGCRQDIPIQFRIRPSVKARSGNSNFTLVYTVVASIT
ncbi:hypothetical protein [Urechidicola croceus]|nr:hypothetical protein [Urechidicola croceus]